MLGVYIKLEETACEERLKELRGGWVSSLHCGDSGSSLGCPDIFSAFRGLSPPMLDSVIGTFRETTYRRELVLQKHVVSEVISFTSHFLLKLFLCDGKSNASYRTEIISEAFCFL